MLFVPCCCCRVTFRPTQAPTVEAVLADLKKKLTAGQSTLTAEVRGFKNQLIATNKTISGLNKRIAQLEGHYHKLTTLQSEFETTQVETAQTSHQVYDLEALADDAEDRFRQNNLICYGIPDTAASETQSQSKQKITGLCSELLIVTLDLTKLNVHTASGVTHLTAAAQ